MFCIKCGTQVEDDVLFCPKCGTKIERDDDGGSTITSSVQTASSVSATSSVQTASSAYGSYTAGAGVMNNQALKNTLAGVKKPNKKTITMIGVVLAVVVVAIILIANHKTRVNLDKYLVVEYEGYDGIGRAVVSIDKREFFDDNEKLKINGSKLKKYGSISGLNKLLGYLDYSSEASEYVASKGATALYDWVNNSGSLDKYDGLSNGDEIVYTWDIEDQKVIEDILNCKLKYSEKKFEVKGLEKVETFNPFDYVTVEYAGMAPNGRVQIDNSDSNISGLYFRADKDDGLSNGDTITITASYGYSEKEFIDQYGKLPYPLTQTYTVDGLASYISSTSEMPDELIEKMKKQAVDVITSNVANNYSSSYNNLSMDIDSLEYLGNYFLSSKNGQVSDNKVFMVYDLTMQAEMDVEDEGIVKDDYDCYVAVRFEDPMLDTDGTGAVDISNAYMIGSSRYIKTDYKISDGWGSTFSFNLPGYSSLDELYNEIVTKNLANYNHEDNIE